MVGVPGRSKACHTCRIRRKGCDEKRPSCGQCTLSRIPCGGYDRCRIFVNSRQQFDYTGRGPQRFVPASYSGESLLHGPLKPAAVDVTQTRVISEVGLSAPILERSLERSACESKYLEIYWTALLPHGQSFSPQAARFSTTTWTSAIQDLYHKDALVRIVLLANAFTLVAQHNESTSLMVQGGQFYNLSLQGIAKSLLDSKRWSADRMLAASGLLASYELLLNADGRGSWLPAPTWLRHTSGEMAIILASGPKRFVEGNAHKLFVDYRLHLIYPYIQNYHCCPLSSLEWKTIPWSTQPKWPKDSLLDILVEIPGLLQHLANLKSASSQQENRYLLLQALEERCWQCDAELQSWSTSHGKATLSFVQDLANIQDLDENSEDSAPPSTNLAIAHLGMVYWTTYNLLSQILCCLREANQSKQDVRSLPPRIDAYLYSRKVAALVPYFRKPGVGSYLISFIGFPVTVAASFLARQDSRGDYVEARALLVKVFRGERGKQLQKFLATWPWITRAESDTLGATET